jgi:hypothetical protein
MTQDVFWPYQRNVGAVTRASMSGGMARAHTNPGEAP